MEPNKGAKVHTELQQIYNGYEIRTFNLLLVVEPPNHNTSSSHCCHEHEPTHSLLYL
jgi:hypothetical protein